MKKMDLETAYEILEKSSEGFRYPFSIIREAQRLIEENNKKVDPVPSYEGSFLFAHQLSLIDNTN